MVRRTYTYIVFGLGILLVVAGILKVPGGYIAGAALAFLGLLLFGLSFVPLQEPSQEPSGEATPPMSDFERLGGIFFEPSRVFRSLRAHPHWLVPILITSLLSFAYSTAFSFRLTPERIVSFTNDKLVEKGWVPADKAEEIKAQQVEQAKSPPRIVGAAITTFVGTFVFIAIIAALYMLGVLLFGGRMGFWQALAVAAWAALPPFVIGRVLSLVLLYLKDPDEIHPILGQSGLVTDNLGALVKPGEHPVIFAVLSAFGVLAFYHLWLTATGLRNGGERVSSSSAWTIAIIFWGIGLLFAVCSSALFGNFIS
ncbi:MAG: hypothetical protein QOC99_106 [Acidobacteriota bacterium]|nr:hypothetical protein [Acidobacteriota bacterium]MDT7777594.1 hypothetical protein [Acidobacteriota bacterium]